MAKRVLIAGASGLIGTRISELLLNKGFAVSHLSRKQSTGSVPSFVWDVERGEIDSMALKNVDCVINLAGTGVADSRWTVKRKKEILDSRIQSTRLLSKELKKKDHHVDTFISASAIGYYGIKNGESWVNETSPPGTDFLAQVVSKWEAATQEISTTGLRIVKLRIGIVLSEKGGALKSMATPVRWGVGAPLGNGKQYLSWIHIDDLCGMFIKAVEDPQLNGIYNAVGVDPVTNIQLTKAIAKVLHRPLWLPPIPPFVMRLILGEMADMLLYGAKISSAKIQQTNFNYQFTELDVALRNLLK